ncbi:MAG: alpha-2-macroglobulin family protein, partial [Acidobacteriota bacterium]
MAAAWMVCALLASALCFGSASAAAEPTVVPDRFLRPWDPLTIFFQRDVGPAGGGPEDRPERFVRLEPAHPGVWEWLDARTLRLRPVDPWPALERFRLEIDGSRHRLATLLEAPIATQPAAAEIGVGRRSSIELTFARPLEIDDLARALTVELRPLPGVDRAAARWLDRRDFEIKPLERAARDAAATYSVRLARPLPAGQRVLVHLQLSLDSLPVASWDGAAAPVEDGAAGRITAVEFSTVEAFRAVGLGCGRSLWPVDVEGVRYGDERLLRCQASEVRVRFSAPLGALDPVAARNLLRLEPSVAGLELSVEGLDLVARGDFARDRAYRVTLAPHPLRDAEGRTLRAEASSALSLFFPAQPSFLAWTRGSAVVELAGPRQVPLRGRGESRADLRIHRIDPLDRGFWPFPEAPVEVDESRRPPGPGEEPAADDGPLGRPTAETLASRLTTLGSPVVSTLVDLPLDDDGDAARFGLDLRTQLRQAAGADRPGHYLLGLRRLDGSTARSWLRLQVTDLALTTIEEARQTVFVVTSAATAEPLAGVEVRVEGGVRRGGLASWETFFTGRTDASGRVAWRAPGGLSRVDRTVRRLIARQGDDVLVLDAATPPDRFADGAWTDDGETWLQWALRPLDDRGRPDAWRAHLFTERPIYRPDEPVHLVAWLRRYRADGRLELPPIDRAAGGDWQLVIDGPAGRSWRQPARFDAAGAVYWRFAEDDAPTGTYRVRLEDPAKNVVDGGVTFRKEAYRLPRFEVTLDGPRAASGPVDARLDEPFEVSLLATYYAGGRVAERPVDWRVTQFPLAYQPPAREGFVWSSDGRFSRVEPFRARPAIERRDATDGDGAATLRIDPALEPTAQPRTYVVEATVIGADDQTVTSTQRVRALPPFLLGLDVPRWLEPGAALRPRLLMVAADGTPIADREVTLRLLHRQWHSHLQASDVTDGVARYVTDVVDEPVEERSVKTGGEPLEVELPIGTPGVYVVELEARDRLGRAQVVRVDLYAAGGGEAPVAWQRPKAPILEVSTDAASYRPGETGRLVLESPWQTARALVVVEAPAGNRYRWIDVRGGEGVVELPIEDGWAPRLPVHVALMRGRGEGDAAVDARSGLDLGRPATLAATRWLDIEPVDRRVEVTLEHPPQALPGREITIDVRLTDPDGAPLAGRVALWLVDRAVLALAPEARLDPLPSFVRPEPSHVALRDTRSLLVGLVPFAEIPGGGVAAEKASLLDRVTVRKNFDPVPFFEPAIEVGPDGRASVVVPLRDDLTDFAIRAKALAGAERFGFATSRLAVRLPVIVQPALPRFVRPGDHFTASAIGRLVSGDPGPGRAEAAFEGLELDAGVEPTREVQWLPDRPERLDFPVRVAEDAAEAVVRVAVERSTDGAADAFEVRLPVSPAVRPEIRRQVLTLFDGGSHTWEAPAGARALERQIIASTRAELLDAAIGLETLLAYPYGCTEQRLSTTRALLAFDRLGEALGFDTADDDRVAAGVTETLAWLDEVVGDDGLAAYWPGGRGYVSLSAWVLELLTEAERGGHSVDPQLATRLRRALERALRSDFSGFVDGAAWAERTMALQALAASGDAQPAYLAEMARRAEVLSAESVARVVTAADLVGDATVDLSALVDLLWRAVVLERQAGESVYGGLREGARPPSPRVLPSEARALAEIVRALGRRAPDDPRLPVLIDGLVALGGDDGWGETQADAAAILALLERLEAENVGEAPVASAAASALEVVDIAGATTRLEASALVRSTTATEGTLVLTARGGEPVRAALSARWLPTGDPAAVEAARNGFVVERELAIYEAGAVAPRVLSLDAPAEVQLRV